MKREQNMRSWRNWQTRTVQVRVGNRGGSNPLDRTKKIEQVQTCSIFYCDTNLGIRTRKGIAVKRGLPVEGRVGDGPSRPSGEAQDGGCGSIRKFPPPAPNEKTCDYKVTCLFRLV